jgi:hypothetical protein
VELPSPSKKDGKRKIRNEISSKNNFTKSLNATNKKQTKKLQKKKKLFEN